MEETKKDELKEEVAKELLEKSKKQQEAAKQINDILAENGLTLIIEQNVRIIPKQ